MTDDLEFFYSGGLNQKRPEKKGFKERLKNFLKNLLPHPKG